MKKIYLPLLTLVLSQNFSSAMENPNNRGEDSDSQETEFNDLPTEVHAHIFSFLDPDEAARIQLNRHYRDVHKEFYKEMDPKALNTLERFIPKIIDKSITLDASENLKIFLEEPQGNFYKMIDPNIRKRILNLTQDKIMGFRGAKALTNGKIQNILKKIYTPEHIFSQFGGEKVPVKMIIQRFKAHLTSPGSIFIDLYIHFIYENWPNLQSNDINTNTLRHDKNWKFLQLQGMHITYLSPEIGKLTDITNLNLTDNQLEILPPEIGNLQNLKNLNLTNNNLKSLPTTLEDLIKLESLTLAGNNFETLPIEIGQLKNLDTLNLRDNPLILSKETWETLLNLPKLKRINLENTKVHPELRKYFLLTTPSEKKDFIELVSKHYESPENLKNAESFKGSENSEENPDSFESPQNNGTPQASQKKSFFSRIWKRNDRT